MADAIIPVDLRNPGQVFACLGLMEAAEILIGPAEGAYHWSGRETRVTFRLSVDGPADPVLEVLRFLSKAEVRALVPPASTLDTDKWNLQTVHMADPRLGRGCADPLRPVCPAGGLRQTRRLHC